MKIILFLFFVLFSIRTFATEESSVCIITVENEDVKRRTKNIEEFKGTLTSPLDGITGKRFAFPLDKQSFKCELAFSGKKRGLFINCWNGDWSLGIKNDSSSIEKYNAHKEIYKLEISTPTTSSRISARCI